MMGLVLVQDGVDGQSVFGDLKSEYSVASSRRSRQHRDMMKPTTSDIHGTARPLQQRVAYDRKEGRENVQKDWVRISVQRKICISECLNSLVWSEPCLMLTDEPTSTKDNSTNAEDRPAVDQEVKEMAEVSTSWEMAPLAPIPLDL